MGTSGVSRRDDADPDCDRYSRRVPQPGLPPVAPPGATSVRLGVRSTIFVPPNRMSIPLLIEWFVSLVLIVTCVSHIAQPRAWVELFIDLLRKPYGGLVIGIFTVQTGLIVVICHNIWVLDAAVIVTVIGWGWTIKGTLYLLMPSLPQKVARRHLEHPQRFAIAGMVGLVIGGIVLMRLLFLSAES